ATGGQSTANKGSAENPAIALMTVLGEKPSGTAVVNEMTTIASVWTHAQFLDGTAIKGPPLGLHIAAGNVPNFVDLQTGGYGTAIQDALNSTQTPTMPTFATLSTVLAGCVTQVKADACSSLFAAVVPPSGTLASTTQPRGKPPSDTLSAAQLIARTPQ